MNLMTEVLGSLDDHIDLARSMDAVAGDLVRAVELVTETFRGGGKLLLAGNGGSAADAQHWAAEWVVRLSPDIKRPALPAIALTTDTSVLTAGANDLGFDQVFARQLEALTAPNDLFIAISTSGESENLIQAARTAHRKGARVLGVLGRGGGRLAAECDLNIIVPASDTQGIQEMHLLIGHLLCGLSERVLATESAVTNHPNQSGLP